MKTQEGLLATDGGDLCAGAYIHEGGFSPPALVVQQAVGVPIDLWTRERAGWVWPILRHFAETGELGAGPETDERSVYWMQNLYSWLQTFAGECGVRSGDEIMPAFEERWREVKFALAELECDAECIRNALKGFAADGEALPDTVVRLREEWRQLGDGVLGWQNEAKQLGNQCDRLREALEPFAATLAGLSEDGVDASCVLPFALEVKSECDCHERRWIPTVSSVRMSDIKRAHAVLHGDATPTEPDVPTAADMALDPETAQIRYGERETDAEEPRLSGRCSIQVGDHEALRMQVRDSGDQSDPFVQIDKHVYVSEIPAVIQRLLEVDRHGAFLDTSD